MANRPKEIAEIEVQTTREKVTAGDIFKVRSGGVDSICFEGGSTRLDNIGKDMKSGRNRRRRRLRQIAWPQHERR